MATNTLAGIATDRKATIFYFAGALGASVTSTVHPRTAASATDLKTTAEMLGRNARGKIIPRFFCLKASGSAANWTVVKVQHANALPGVAEASWDWGDLITFTALTTDVATFEAIEPTVPIRPFLRVLLTRVAGTLTGLRIGYEYAQTGPRASFGSSVFVGSLT